MHRDFEACYRAVASRDARFDGRFFAGVASTGIYCRPVCPARTPARRNVRFFACAAAAEAAGFRACRRCRPEAAPHTWDTRGDVVGRALHLIADGVVDDERVAGLARRLAVSQRHLHRLFMAELGAGPLTVARTRRAQTARILLDGDLPVSEIAFAAGYGSIRQFNDAVREAFGATPTDLRRARRGTAPGSSATLSLRLQAAEPFAAGPLRDHLAARTLPGVEESAGGTYRRTVPGGVVEVVLPAPGGPPVVRLRARLDRDGDLAAVVRGVRALCDLDANPDAVAAVLGADPLLSPSLAARPGLRVPGAVDGFECAVRVVLGQQVSVAGAVTLAARLVRRHGTPLAAPDGALTHRFPRPATLAEADLSGLGITGVRIRGIQALAAAVRDGRLQLDPRADREATVAHLSTLPGFGPWTVTTVALRALRDPDAFPAGDLGLRRALAAVTGDGTAAVLSARAEAWRPWRAYAATHLWTAVTAPAAALTKGTP